MTNEKLPKWRSLDFWTGVWPIAVAAAYGIGMFFLNLVYVNQWGVSDFSVSNIQCAVAALWLVGTPVLAFRLDAAVDSSFKWLATNIPLIVSCVLSRLREWTPRWLWWVGVPSTLIGAFFARHYLIVPIHWTAQVLLPVLRYYRVWFIVAIDYSFCLLFWMIAASFWNKRPVRPGGEGSLEGGLFLFGTKRETSYRAGRVFFFVMKFALFAWACWFSRLTFELSFLAVPERIGGGSPDPVLLWVSTNSVPLLSEGDVESGECSGAEFAIYKGMSLAHEGSDYFVLYRETSSQYMIISKDVVKRHQLASRTDGPSLNLFHGSIRCVSEIPIKSTQVK